MSNYVGSIFASVSPLALDHLGAGQDQGLQTDASKSIDGLGSPTLRATVEGWSGRAQSRGAPPNDKVLMMIEIKGLVHTECTFGVLK